MNKKTNCLIVGCGGIGRHHFSSLSKTPNVHLFGVDKSRSSLDILEKRLQEEGVSKGGVTLSEDLEITKGEKIKFAVIATPSRGRVKVLREVLKHAEVEVVVLEKLLSPNKNELYLFDDILKEFKATKFFVNCPRRLYPIYKSIKGEVENASKLDLYIEGGAWNLGSNAIHILDLFTFLNGNDKITKFHCNGQFETNKRHAGYDEFYGELTFSSKKGTLRMVSGRVPKGTTISIFTEQESFVLFESKKICVSINKESASRFELPYQSNLTSECLEKSLRGEDIGLISLEDSLELHRNLFSCLDDEGRSLT